MKVEEKRLTSRITNLLMCYFPSSIDTDPAAKSQNVRIPAWMLKDLGKDIELSGCGALWITHTSMKNIPRVSHAAKRAENFRDQKK